MYRYVLSTHFFAYSCTDFSSFRKGTYQVHADSGGVRTFGSWFYCAPAGPPSRLACERFRHRPHIETNHTKALAGLFTAAWQHPCQCLSAWAGAGCLLGDSDVAGQLHPICDHHDQLSAHQQQQHLPATQCALRTGVWRTWAFKLGRPWWAAKYLSNPAKFKFRDIREIKQEADLAWSWAEEMVTWEKVLRWSWEKVLRWYK
jgi:hypothetical protein